MKSMLKTCASLLVLTSLVVTPPTAAFAQATSANTITFRTTDKPSAEDLAARIDAAMAQGHKKIVVNFSPYTKTLPEPVAVWIRRIQDTKGEVYVRSLAKNPLLAQLIAAILPTLTRLVAGLMNKWLGGLGDPAKNYNAMIVTNTLGAGQPDCFVRVEFYLRKSPEWNTERAKGKPLAETNVPTQGTSVESTEACPVEVK